MADVTLPQLGETVTEGTITQWFKQVGDTVAADEPLFEVSTDKVDTEVPSPIAGVVSEIRAAEGDTIAVGTVVAVIGSAAPASAAPPVAPAPAAEPAVSEPVAQPVAPVTPAVVEPVTPPAPVTPPLVEPAAPHVVEPAASPIVEPAPAAPSTVRADDGADGRLLSPVVRRLIAEHGIDPDSLTGTGPGGRITRDDVMDHVDRIGGAATPGASPAAAPTVPVEPAPPAAVPATSQATAAPKAVSEPAPVTPEHVAPPQPASVAATSPEAVATPTRAAAPAPIAGERDTSIRLSKIRKLTGDHMVMSKAVSPHAFSVVEIDYANVDDARMPAKDAFKATEGISLTYLPFIARALVDALGEFPHLNASLGDGELIVHNYVDLGIAVDLDYEGLLAPVVRSAESKRLRALAREIGDLATRARARKLSPDEIHGGTFTISNNGSAGSVLTMPIINQPQVAIVSTDAIVRKPVVARVGGAEAITIHPIGNLAMSWDHRAFDGAYAAGFLRRVKEILETRDWSAEL